MALPLIITFAFLLSVLNILNAKYGWLRQNHSAVRLSFWLVSIVIGLLLLLVLTVGLVSLFIRQS